MNLGPVTTHTLSLSLSLITLPSSLSLSLSLSLLLPISSSEGVFKVDCLEYADRCSSLLLQTLVHVVRMALCSILKEYLPLLAHSWRGEKALKLLTATITAGVRVGRRGGWG